MPSVTYTAPVVCPMGEPPFADGGVVVEGGTIRAVGPATAFRDVTERTHHVDGVLAPGFVNASTRFEHSDARAEGGGTQRWDDDRWRRSAHRGVQEALRAGVTAAGDVVARGTGVPPACRAGLAGDSFVEVPAGAEVRPLVAALERALDQPAPGRRVGIAVPAAPEPAEFDAALLAAVAELCSRRGAPLRIRGGAPVAAIDDTGALFPRVTFEPCRPLGAQEVERLVRRGVTLVARPRSVADEPIEDYAAAGLAVALGTGGTRGPDVLAEAAAWVAAAARRGTTALMTPAAPLPVAEHAVRLATAAGAAAAGWEGAGTLAAGRRADLAGFAVATTPVRVYEDLLGHGPGRRVLTVVGGVRKARRADPDQPWPSADRADR